MRGSPLYPWLCGLRASPRPSRSFNPLTGEGAEEPENGRRSGADRRRAGGRYRHAQLAVFRAASAGRRPIRRTSSSFKTCAFVLNMLDSLAGDERYLEIRKRREHYGTLTGFEAPGRESPPARGGDDRHGRGAIQQDPRAGGQRKEQSRNQVDGRMSKIEKSGNEGELLAARYKREMEMIQATVKETKAKEKARRDRNTELNQADDSRERERANWSSATKPPPCSSRRSRR